MKLSFRHIAPIFSIAIAIVCGSCSCVGTSERSATVVDTLLYQADSLFQISETDKALSTQMQAYRVATTDIQRAYVQIDMAQIHYFIGQVDVATNILEQSIAIFDSKRKLTSTDEAYHLEALMLYADILNSENIKEKAVENYKKATDIALKIKDMHAYFTCCLYAIKYYTYTGDYFNAISLCRETLSHTSDITEDMEIDKFSVMFEMHALLSLLGDYHEAQIYLNEMHLMSHDAFMHFVVDVSALFQNIYNPFADLNQMSECAARLNADINETGLTECYEMNALTLLATYYIRINDYQSAKMCIDSYLNVAKNDKMTINNAYFYLTEAEILLHYSKLDSVRNILNNPELIKTSESTSRFSSQYNRMQSLYYGARCEYEKEYKYAQKMTILADSVQAEIINHNLAYRDMVHQRDTTILGNAIRISQKQSKLEAFAFWQAIWVIIIIATFLIAVIIALNVVIELLKEREREIYQQNLQLQREVVRHTSILQTQKVELEQTNNRLNREIRYAGRIQRDILSSESVLNSPLIRGHFVYYKPCQHISGDFYWFYAIGDRQFVLCADATGHGIPGAFVSMVCSTLLNDIVSTSEMSAAELVRTLDVRLRSILRNNNNTHANDSIDASLVCIDNKTGRITISLARHKARIVRKDGTLEYVQGVKRSIGDIDEAFTSRPFVEVSCHFEHGDELFLTSDGLESQFGGIDGRKLKSHRMDDMFRLMAQQKIENQRDYLDKFFRNWRGDCEQTDDVLVIGLAF